MSTVKLNRDDPEDLSIRARQGRLSAAEQRDLERLLEASAALRIAHRVGRDFDRLSAVQAGDEELIARAAHAALARRAGRTGPSRRLALALGIAAALVTSGALAWWAGIVQPNRRAEHAETRAVGSDPGGDGAKRAGGPGAEVAAETAVGTPASQATATEPEGHAAARSAHVDMKKSALKVAGEDNAAGDSSPAVELFRRANAERRIGNFGRARALYGELEAKFPMSDEARLSHVSMGKLLFLAGRNEEAEHQFALYASLGGGDLAEEALVGRAQSFERLGRGGDEQRVWQKLVQDFPSSVYVARAKQRLAELGALGR